MKEKVESKIEEIINNILAKEKEKITYEEFSMLMFYLFPLKMEEGQKKSEIEINKMFEKFVNSGDDEDV